MTDREESAMGHAIKLFSSGDHKAEWMQVGAVQNSQSISVEMRFDTSDPPIHVGFALGPDETAMLISKLSKSLAELVPND